MRPRVPVPASHEFASQFLRFFLGCLGKPTRNLTLSPSAPPAIFPLRYSRGAPDPSLSEFRRAPPSVVARGSRSLVSHQSSPSSVATFRGDRVDVASVLAALYPDNNPIQQRPRRFGHPIVYRALSTAARTAFARRGDPNWRCFFTRLLDLRSERAASCQAPAPPPTALPLSCSHASPTTNHRSHGRDEIHQCHRTAQEFKAGKGGDSIPAVLHFGAFPTPSRRAAPLFSHPAFGPISPLLAGPPTPDPCERPLQVPG